MLTAAQQRALKWLTEQGGSGVIDNHGRMLAGGELATHIAEATWLRLIAHGHLRGGNGRIAVVCE